MNVCLFELCRIYEGQCRARGSLVVEVKMKNKTESEIWLAAETHNFMQVKMKTEGDDDTELQLLCARYGYLI